MSDEHDISWALKILQRDPDYEENLLLRNAAPCYAAFMGASSIGIANYILKRPLFSGVPIIATFAACGYGIGVLYKRMVDKHYRAMEENVYHYITLHPEDFPPPKRTKYADLFEPWVPVR